MYKELILGPAYFEAKKFLRESQYWSGDDLKSWQAETLNDLLEYAVLNIPYYRRQVSLSEIRKSCDIEIKLSHFPILSKRI